MRIDSCRKCGIAMREYDETQRCKTCGKGIDQFTCIRCNIVTEPQYHIHKVAPLASVAS